MRRIIALLTIIAICFVCLITPVFAAEEKAQVFPELTHFKHPPVQHYSWEPDSVVGGLDILYMLAKALMFVSALLVNLSIVIFQYALHPTFFGDLFAEMVRIIKASEQNVLPIIWGFVVIFGGAYFAWDFKQNNSQRAMKRGTTFVIAMMITAAYYQITAPTIKTISDGIDGTATTLTAVVVSGAAIKDAPADIGMNDKFDYANQYLMGEIWDLLVEDPWQMGMFGKLDATVSDEEAEAINDSLESFWTGKSEYPKIKAGQTWKEYVLQFPVGSDPRDAVVEYLAEEKQDEFMSSFDSGYRLLLAFLSFIGSLVTTLFFLLFGGLLLALYGAFLGIFMAGIIIVPCSMLPIFHDLTILRKWLQWLAYTALGKILLGMYVGLTFLVQIMINNSTTLDPKSGHFSYLLLILVNMLILIISILVFYLLVKRFQPKKRIFDNVDRNFSDRAESTVQSWRKWWNRKYKFTGDDDAADDDDKKNTNDGSSKVDTDRVYSDSGNDNDRNDPITSNYDLSINAPVIKLNWSGEDRNDPERVSVSRGYDRDPDEPKESDRFEETERESTNPNESAVTHDESDTLPSQHEGDQTENEQSVSPTSIKENQHSVNIDDPEQQPLTQDVDQTYSLDALPNDANTKDYVPGQMDEIEDVDEQEAPRVEVDRMTFEDDITEKKGGSEKGAIESPIDGQVVDRLTVEDDGKEKKDRGETAVSDPQEKGQEVDQIEHIDSAGAIEPEKAAAAGNDPSTDVKEFKAISPQDEDGDNSSGNIGSRESLHEDAAGEKHEVDQIIPADQVPEPNEDGQISQPERSDHKIQSGTERESLDNMGQNEVQEASTNSYQTIGESYEQAEPGREVDQVQAFDEVAAAQDTGARDSVRRNGLREESDEVFEEQVAPGQNVDQIQEYQVENGLPESGTEGALQRGNQSSTVKEERLPSLGQEQEEEEEMHRAGDVDQVTRGGDESFNEDQNQEVESQIIRKKFDPLSVPSLKRSTATEPESELEEVEEDDDDRDDEDDEGVEDIEDNDKSKNG